MNKCRLFTEQPLLIAHVFTRSTDPSIALSGGLLCSSWCINIIDKRFSMSARYCYNSRNRRTERDRKNSRSMEIWLLLWFLHVHEIAWWIVYHIVSFHRNYAYPDRRLLLSSMNTDRISFLINFSQSTRHHKYLCSSRNIHRIRFTNNSIRIYYYNFIKVSLPYIRL